jgi:hypothetical protein
VSLGKELQPLVGEGALRFFAYVYGHHVGLALLAISILCFFSSKHALRRSRQRCASRSGLAVGRGQGGDESVKVVHRGLLS